MTAEALRQSRPFILCHPDPFDWIHFARKVPVALYHHKKVYGRNLPGEFHQNFSGSLLIDYWRKLTGIPAKTVEATGVYEILGVFGTLVRRYDQLIDQAENNDRTFRREDFKGEQFLPVASALSQAILQSSLTHNQRKQLYQTIDWFRRTEVNILNTHHTTPQDQFTFNQAVAIREMTNSPLALVTSDILCSRFNLSPQVVNLSRQFLVHFFHAGQAIDDIADCQTDLGGRNPNLFIAALNENPGEKQRFVSWTQQPREKFLLEQLTFLAPKSMKMVHRYVEDQTAQIPQGTGITSAVRFAYYFPKGIIK